MAFETYLSYTRLGGASPLQSCSSLPDWRAPSQDSCLRSICQEAYRFLEAYDLTGIA